MTPLAHVLALPVRAYRLVLSPWVGHGCRFQPTCSAYALDALSRHGGVRGGALTIRRLCRCHPWGGQGYDPVPGADPDNDRSCRSGNPDGHRFVGTAWPEVPAKGATSWRS